MNIVFLSYFSGISRRGVETYVHELANRLVALGHTVTVFQSGSHLSGSKYRTITLSSSQFIFTLKAASLLPQNTDVVIPTNGRFQALVFKLWTVLHRKKLIISGQSGPGADDKWNLYCFPDYFIALTPAQAAWAKKINPFVSLETIPNGVDLQLFQPHGDKLPLPLKHPIVLYVAALEPIKRHRLLIEAVAHTSASLVLVGEGSLNEQLQSLGQKLLPKRFQILSLPRDQMPALYRSCDIFAYPTSKYESFGIAMVEAMASGLPVIATNDHIRNYLVSDAGVLVDPENIHLFSQKISQLISHRQKYHPRNRASDFSWDSIARKYHHLLTSLK